MSTKVNEGLPCAYPEQTTETSIYYPLESSNFIPKCDKLDTRYEILSSELQTDQLTVQTLSTVFDTLSALPKYDISDESKATTKYEFWTRKVIGWSCSAEEQQEAFEAVKAYLEVFNEVYNVDSVVDYYGQNYR